MIGMMLIFVLHTGGNEGVMCTKCKALMLPEDFYSLFHLLDYVLFLSVLEHVKFSLSGLTCLVKLSIVAHDPPTLPTVYCKLWWPRENNADTSPPSTPLSSLLYNTKYYQNTNMSFKGKHNKIS